MMASEDGADKTHGGAAEHDCEQRERDEKTKMATASGIRKAWALRLSASRLASSYSTLATEAAACQACAKQ